MTDPGDPTLLPPVPDPVIGAVPEHPEPGFDPRTVPLPPGSLASDPTTPDVTPTTLTHQVTDLMNLMDSAFKNTTLDWAAVAPHLLSSIF